MPSRNSAEKGGFGLAENKRADGVLPDLLQNQAENRHFNKQNGGDHHDRAHLRFRALLTEKKVEQYEKRIGPK